MALPTRDDNLETTKDQIASLLVQLTRQLKPDYSKEGQTVQWASYLQQLLDAQKTAAEIEQVSQGPFEVRSIGRT